MHRALKRAAALLLALCLLPLPALADNGGGYGNELIPGVDYDRFTQKAMKGQTGEYDAVLALGEVEIHGKFHGMLGLTYEEMNEIIVQKMKEKKLTLEEVEVFSTLGSELQKEWYKNKRTLAEIGKKFANAFSNYIPVVGADIIVKVSLDQLDINFSESYSVGEHSYMGVQEAIATYGGVKLTVAEEYYKYQRGKIINGLSKSDGAKALAKAKFPNVPFGWITFFVGSVNAGIELLNTDAFDEFNERMANIMALISDFYSSCSRAMNDLAEQKNTKNVCFDFDDTSAIYIGKFLGVDGVAAAYRLSGKLFKTDYSDAIDLSNTGSYEGELELTVEALDMMENFDKPFLKQSDLWQQGSLFDWQLILNRLTGVSIVGYGEGLPGVTCTDEIREETRLKRTLRGNFRAVVPSFNSGTVTAVLSGKFNNISDKINFAFYHVINQQGSLDVVTASPDPSFIPENLGPTSVSWFITRFDKPSGIEDDPYYLDVEWVGNSAADYYYSQSVGQVMYSGGSTLSLSKDQFGTLWVPLSSAPELRVTVPAAGTN